VTSSWNLPEQTRKKSASGLAYFLKRLSYDFAQNQLIGGRSLKLLCVLDE